MSVNVRIRLLEILKHCSPSCEPATFVDFPLTCVGAYVYFIYKLKFKKIIYSIELRFTSLVEQVKIECKNKNATGLRIAFLWLSYTITLLSESE